jgi:exonuclease VII large subunit
MTSFLTDYIAKQLEKVLKDYLVDFSTGNISKVSDPTSMHALLAMV